MTGNLDPRSECRHCETELSQDDIDFEHILCEGCRAMQDAGEPTLQPKEDDMTDPYLNTPAAKKAYLQRAKDSFQIEVEEIPDCLTCSTPCNTDHGHCSDCLINHPFLSSKEG